MNEKQRGSVENLRLSQVSEGRKPPRYIRLSAWPAGTNIGIKTRLAEHSKFVGGLRLAHSTAQRSDPK